MGLGRRGYWVGLGCIALSTAFVAAPQAAGLKRSWSAADICVEAASESLKPDIPASARRAIIKACEEAMRSGATTKACDRVAAKATKDLRFPIAYTCYGAVDINEQSR